MNRPRDALLGRIIALANDDARVTSLLLSGSLGRGDGDDWSDIDLIAVVAPEDHKGFVAGAREWLAPAAPLVLWSQPFAGAPLFNAVAEDWLRYDLTIVIPGHAPTARDRCRALIDRGGVWAALPETLPPRAADPARVAAMVQEFIRILALLPLGLGREEFAVGVTGVGLLRTQLISLLIEALDLPQPPGALHLSRLLPAEDMALLKGLPPVAATGASVLASSRALAEAFLPRARRLMARVGAPWPEALWTAAQAHLHRNLGTDWPPLD